jgi:hypothetical protein
LVRTRQKTPSTCTTSKPHSELQRHLRSAVMFQKSEQL